MLLLINELAKGQLNLFIIKLFLFKLANDIKYFFVILLKKRIFNPKYIYSDFDPKPSK